MIKSGRKLVICPHCHHPNRVSIFTRASIEQTCEACQHTFYLDMRDWIARENRLDGWGLLEMLADFFPVLMLITAPRTMWRRQKNLHEVKTLAEIDPVALTAQKHIEKTFYESAYFIGAMLFILIVMGILLLIGAVWLKKWFGSN